MTHWEVISPGLLSTVQDQGREGWRHLGVARAGAMDLQAADIANRLLGNSADAAVLEMTIKGPTLHVPRPTRVAITGAETGATANGAPVPGHRPVLIPAGELKFANLRNGIRAWLAVQGGFQVPQLMGSRSTDLRGGFGGVEGRALRAGDRIAVGNFPIAGKPTRPQATNWWTGSDDPCLQPSHPIRFVARENPLSAALAGRIWTVDARSNRQGLRLQGDPLADSAHSAHSGVSEPVAVGSIQLPPDGQPIVLLADAQTVGGYARLGHVIAADLPRLAQAGAGTLLAFEQVDNDTARALLKRQLGRHARACMAIAQRLGKPA